MNSYKELVNDPKALSSLDVKAEREIADYRAFFQIGEVHARNVTNRHSINIMSEVVEQLQNALQERKKVLDLTQ
jgi:hypothetical protein